jgi:hypothetical protein
VPPLIDFQMIDQVAADVVGRSGVEPDIPARHVRFLGRHQRELHGASGLELVARDQLVLQLEHQDDDNHHRRERCRADLESKPPGIEPLGAEDEQDERCRQHHASRWGELQQQAFDEPPDAAQPAPELAQLGEPFSIRFSDVEAFEAGEGAADGPSDAAALDVFDDDADVVGQRRPELPR